jgi:hypothetical protein
VPPAFLDTLNIVHNINAAQRRRDRAQTLKLWDWSRSEALYVVCGIMDAAKITGSHATPKDCGMDSASRP